ncbi:MULTISPECIES: DeoR/GlpR family DNA-binding transcription regulator [Alicyclobacillus]|uniref:DeoR/GlpR family DNA-binding transcription regulator n=1 Tax=Alicyclobacillus acidoterrestris (strain ATCC 49025 / DSM 3922 / CIP 106132 / NCIMB 13137 / GD3B) TaxID=1356854 RepID=T0D9U7_ALIAG|nr:MULTISPECIES: DeoR/GlpR family DNA-binding transcription regulator [Alicyclobacillus]EPZ48242.1 hypothetical protein N007_00555 [Alicyclobacillus acidoterrestris ATCC 49025]UNO50434.1 DeoR/GlpR family DNA-binding transcription regulator [Alicyclobacillus acidoterrestris]
MYPAQRRDALVRLLSTEGFVSIHDLATRFDVSEITIRRDLKVLQQQGLVEKVVGGGQLTKSANEPTFMHKRVLQQAEKERIATTALTLIESGMTIGLSAGTTTWTLANRLRYGIRGIEHLTFVTNSTNVAIALKSNGWDDIHLTGGHFRTPSDALVGPLAEESARRLHTDLLFLGVHGVDLAAGVSTPNLQEASIDRVLMERTETVVLVFDHTKWGIRALAHLATLDEVDVVVTDEGDNAREIAQLRQLGPEVLTVSSSQSEGVDNHGRTAF